MNKQDIVEYVMHTPGNTNKAVLNSMLNQLSNSDENNTNNENLSLQFYKSTVTFQIAGEGLGTTFSIGNGEEDFSSPTFQIAYYGFIVENDKIITEVNNFDLEYPDTKIIELYTIKNNYCRVYSITPDPPTIEGDARIAYDNEMDSYYVEIYGDCTIIDQGCTIKDQGDQGK